MPDTPQIRSLAHLLGFHYAAEADGDAVVEVIPLPEHCNEHGAVHGGFIAALLDTTTGWAIHLALPEGNVAPHFGLTIQYLNPAVPGVLLRCAARATKAGRRVGATDAEVVQNGTVISRALSSHVILPRSGPRTGGGRQTQ